MSNRKRGKTLNSQSRELIIKLQKIFEREYQNGGPLISINRVQDRVADALGISRQTVSKINKEKFGPSGSEENKLHTPRMKWRKTSTLLDIDSFDSDAIRNHVYGYYTRNEYPTRAKLLVSLKEAGLFNGGKTTLSALMKKIGFQYCTTNKRKVLMERGDILLKRNDCLREAKKITDWNDVVFLDEMWLNANYTLKNLCRVCLNCIEEGDMNSLSSTYGNQAFSDIIKLFTAVQINPEDGLPSNICPTCQSDAIHCYKFKMKCEKSDYILQSLLKEQFILAEDIKSEDTIVSNSDADGIIEGMEEQYLEENDNLSSDDQSVSLCIVQKTGNKEKDELEITVTDSKSFIEKVLSGNKTSEKQKSCNFCFKKFSKVKNLRAHIMRHHRSEKHSHPCDQCKETFTSQHDLQVHSALHKTGPIWTCNICQKEFKVKQKLRRHIQRHMEAKRFTCDACGKTFCELYALRRHARVHTGEALDKKHACHICDKRYSESSTLALHLAGHRGERPCVCAVCGKTFASARLLASHRRVHSDAKPHACRYCDKRFRHESTLNTHHRTHTGEKPYVCATCGKTFIQNSNLTLHMRTHTGEKPYSCNKCDQKFTSGSSLKAHQRRHTGEKPYSCDVCGKRFARMDLSAHKRVHAGARPHACSACPRRFRSAARLRTHCRIHTGEKPFECATCAKTFSAKSHLVHHMKKHQTKKTQENKEDIIIVQHVACAPQLYVNSEQIVQALERTGNNESEINCEDTKNDITLEMPLEVSGELVVQDDCDVKEVLVMDNSQIVITKVEM